LPSGTLTIKGNFSNSGSFNHNSGTVKFSSNTTGKTINPGGTGTGKNFYNIQFDNQNGGWTINNNLRAENNFSLTNANSFTLQSGRIIEVNGNFTNLVGGASTTWTDTTLYLNKTGGGSFTINNKNQGSDVYGTLQTGTSTNVRMWNSSAGSYSINASSSLYSMDHNGTDGSLYIWGYYQINSGQTDYWSYLTDFDGENIASSPRQVNVRISPDSSVILNAGALNVIGTSTATTTIDRQGSSGNYALTIQSGTFQANYYQIRNINSDGLNIAGGATIQSLNYGDYLLQTNGAAMMTVNYQAINQNPYLTISGCAFNIAGGVSSGYNVKRSGSANSAWTFTNYSGNYAGESYDYDPDAECGQIRWDDSVCYLHEQVSYRWRADNGIEILGDWTKKKSIPIVNSSSNNLTDYQVKIKVGYNATSSANVDCSGNCQTDFDDIRFVSSDEKSVLSYWRESYTTSSIAVFWVKVPSLPANSTTTIYMYYGNVLANSESSGENTFIFFDDFSGDLSKWTSLSNATTTATTSAHYGSRVMSLGGAGNTNGSAFVNSNYFYDDDVAARVLVYDLGNGSAGSEDADFAFLARYVDSNNYIFGEHDTDTGFHMDQVVSGNQTQLGVNSGDYIQFNQWEWEEWIFWGTSNSDHKAKHWDYATSEPSNYPLSASGTTHFASGVAGLRTTNGQAYIDVLILRKYNSTEPTIATSGSEQNSGTAQWLAEQDNAAQVQKNENVRVRFLVRNTGDNLTNLQYKIQYAPKGQSLSCEAVAISSFVDVSTTTNDVVYMATSSWFAGWPEDSQDQTTNQLTQTTNSVFVAGKMVEATTNKTGVINLNSYQFTEIEYNLKFSQNATGSLYCFRVKNNDSELDGYRKVATVELVQPPEVSNVSLNNGENINLIESSTASVPVTAVVSDPNGYQDIVSISGKIYRSGVGENCSENSNNCYNSVSCATSSCQNNSCNVTCYFNVWFNADPTDNGTPWQDEHWSAYVVATDTDNLSGSATNSYQQVDINSLLAVSVSPVINYGNTLAPGDKIDPLAVTSTVINTGNCSLDVGLYGQDMTSQGHSIPVQKQKFATSSVSYNQAITLDSTSTILDLNLSKNTSTSSLSTSDIWWGIEIPIPQPAALYQGINYIIGQKNSLPW